MNLAIRIPRHNWWSYWHPPTQEDCQVRAFSFADWCVDWYEKTGEIRLYGAAWDEKFQTRTMEDFVELFGPVRESTDEGCVYYENEDRDRCPSAKVRPFPMCLVCAGDRFQWFESEGGWLCERCRKIVTSVRGCLGCARVICEECNWLERAPFTHAEIAYSLGVTGGWVQQMEQRAVRRLREAWYRIYISELPNFRVKPRYYGCYSQDFYDWYHLV